MEKIYDASIEGIGKIIGGNYKNVSIEGIGTIQGDIKAEKIEIEGIGTAKGNINCDSFNVSGVLKCLGNVEVIEKTKISGYVTIKGSCQCRELYSDGKLDIDELLSADKVTLIIEATNKIKEIGGEEIKVIGGSKSIFEGIFYSKILVSDFIEGDNITLEKTECKVVRGHNVIINRDCNIDRVEYSGEISIDKRSKVNNIVKI